MVHNTVSTGGGKINKLFKQFFQQIQILPHQVLRYNGGGNTFSYYYSTATNSKVYINYKSKHSMETIEDIKHK